MFSKAYRTSPALLLALAPAALAQTSPPEPSATTLPDVTVSAARIPVVRTEIGSSVTVITSDEIALKQRRTLPDVLADAPGLNVVRTGGLGSQTSVFMRGTNANHVKVRLDGMDIVDPSTPTGAFDFGPFSASGLSRVEVLRGPQSGLYGADAIGGVIDITTPRGSGPAQAAGSLEAGSFQTFNQNASLRGSTGPFSYYLDVTHLHAGATQTVPEELVPPGGQRRRNYFDSTTVTTRLGYQVTDNFDLNLTARASDSRLHFAGDDTSAFPSVPASELSYTSQRSLFTRLTGHLVSFDGVLEQTVGAGYVDYRRRDQSPAVNGVPSDPTYNRGDRLKLDWRGDVRLGGFGTLVLGVEHILEELRDSPVSASTRTNAGFAELVARHGRLSGSASVRFDGNSRFGDYATWRLAPAFAIPETGTTLKASVGTGFKGPTLNQLFVDFPSFNFFANPNLRAEKSLGWDAGLEQAVGPRVRIGATYFQNAIDDLITTNATFTSYANVAKASTKGIEAFAAWQATDRLKMRVNWTNTVAQDEQTHLELLRRPRTKVSLDTAWQVTDRFSVSSTLLYLSSWVDGNRNFTIPRLRANGFFTADIAVDYKLTGNVALFGRVDNLLDRTYENPSGYLQPGIGAFGGVRFGI